MAKTAKGVAREEIRRRLVAWPKEDRRKASESILQILVARPEWEKIRLLGLFLSLPDEPETRDLIRRAWDEGKKVALPKTDIQHGLTWWEVLPGPLPSLETLWEPLPGNHISIRPVS